MFVLSRRLRTMKFNWFKKDDEKKILAINNYGRYVQL